MDRGEVWDYRAISDSLPLLLNHFDGRYLVRAVSVSLAFVHEYVRYKLLGVKVEVVRVFEVLDLSQVTAVGQSSSQSW